LGDTHEVGRRVALGFISVCLTAALWVLAAAAPAASSLVNHAGWKEAVPEPPPQAPSRIVLYGDSLISEAAQDFSFLANELGAAVRVRAYPGTAICDFFPSMAADAESWRPTVAVLAFSGDAFSPCMAGVQLGSLQYYARYRDDAQTVISIFRSVGARVILVGVPLDSSSDLSQNAAALNQIYRSVSDSDTGVTYDDAGQAVMANGQFTWTLPCLSGEPCTGSGSMNVVRAPDGIHFCPDGKTTLVGSLEVCDVYSSGAARFAAAMLASALPSRTLSPSVSSAPVVCGAELIRMEGSAAGHRTHALSRVCRPRRNRFHEPTS
jgi:hypothetical protein